MFEAAGGKMETFQYKRAVAESDGFGGLPWVLEAAFAYCPDAPWRRLVTGVNWSPAIDNPFKSLGRLGGSLDGILVRQHADPWEPVMVFLHLAHPRVEFTDRGKSAIASTTLDAAILTGLVGRHRQVGEAAQGRGAACLGPVPASSGAGRAARGEGHG